MRGQRKQGGARGTNCPSSPPHKSQRSSSVVRNFSEELPQEIMVWVLNLYDDHTVLPSFADFFRLSRGLILKHKDSEAQFI